MLNKFRKAPVKEKPFFTASPQTFKTISGYATPDYLDHRHFSMMILAAFGLHMLAFYLWHLVPKTPVVDIPVRILSIKLGDGEAEATLMPKAELNANVDTALGQAVHEQEVKMKQRTESVLDSMDKVMNTEKIGAQMQESARKLSSAARQFIRQNATKASAHVPGTEIGNSEATDAEMISRYEQVISLWIQKFKQYPQDARDKGMQGETVVRIRIDRQGNIRYYILERSTGYQQLDRAAIDMIRRANPVPAVPDDYPPGELFEFLIPVNYHLK